MNPSRKQKQTHREQTCGCQEVGVEEGWTGSYRLVDASFYIYNG